MNDLDMNEVWRNEDGTVDWKAFLIHDLTEQGMSQDEIDLIVDVVENGK